MPTKVATHGSRPRPRKSGEDPPRQGAPAPTQQRASSDDNHLSAIRTTVPTTMPSTATRSTEAVNRRLRNSPAASEISTGARSPLIANSTAGPTSPAVIPTRDVTDDTARHTTTSTTPWYSSTRDRTTETVSPSPSSDTHRFRKSTRLSMGSTKHTDRSGRAMARGIPGRPAPDPMSATRSPSSISGDTHTLLRMWRSQIRSVSRGPMRPHSIPSPANNSAYRRARGSRSPKTVEHTPVRSAGTGTDTSVTQTR